MNKPVYFLIDCSDAMCGGRGEAVNALMDGVVKRVVPEILEQKNPDLNVKFKVWGFSGDRTIKEQVRASVEEFPLLWKPISGDVFVGGAPTGAAIQAVIQDIEGGVRGDIDPDALPPVIILISDGEPTGTNPTYDEVMECAVKGGSKEVHQFRRAIRVAIGMNVSEEGRNSLKKFGRLSKVMEERGFSAYYDFPAQSEALFESMAHIIVPLICPISPY